MKLEIGCQGWNYADWTTKAGGEYIFYPRGTRAGEMLEIYAKSFSSVEVDSTFYAIPASATLENWREKTPENFTFALKLPQEITHNQQLKESSFPMAEEFCERIEILREKLGTVLIQLPPQFEATGENEIALKNFVARLPKTQKFAVEFRSRDWLTRKTLDVLGEKNIALCLVEGNWIPRNLMFEAAQTPMANFAYIRFMGERDLQSFDIVRRPQETNLAMWHELIIELSEKVDENFVCFSNFYEGHAPASANKLKRLCGQEVIESKEFETQFSLF